MTYTQLIAENVDDFYDFIMGQGDLYLIMEEYNRKANELQQEEAY